MNVHNKRGGLHLVKICLVCSAGMSTSVLVQRMQNVAKEKGIETEIWAVGESQAKENVTKADVVLLGPQIKYALWRIQEIIPNTPVTAIDIISYGRLDAEKILDDAIALFKKN